MTSGGRPRTVWIFGPLPLPVHGASRVTDLVLRTVVDTGTCVVAIDSNDGAPPVRRLAHMLSGLARLAVARRRSGAVYIGGAGGEVLWYQAVVVLLARLAGFRTVFHHHSYYYLTQTRWTMRIISTVGGRSLIHVVLCPGMGTVLRQRYPSVEDVLVCSNAGLLGPAADVVTAAGDGRSRSRVTLGHLSNLSVEKGLGRVLDTVRLLQSRGVDAHLVLAGPTTSQESATLLAEAVAELGDTLTVLGRLAPDDVDDFYRAIDVFVFPSLYEQEAEPLVVLDAARNGIPTIAHAVGCLPGMVDPANVVPVDADFPEAAAALILGSSAIGPSATVAGTFAERRDGAVAAHARLVDLLLA